MKSTQLAYPTAQQLVQQGILPPPPPKLAKLALAEQQCSEKVHHLRDGAVVLYKRKESSVWQVRFRLFERKDWLSFSTKQRDLGFAKRVAGDMYDRARFKEELGIPQSVKRFSNAADACMKQLDREIEQGLKPRTNLDYKRVIRLYLIPFFGKYNLTSIDGAFLSEQQELALTKQKANRKGDAIAKAAATATQKKLDAGTATLEEAIQ